MAKRYTYKKAHVRLAVGAYDTIGSLVWRKGVPRNLPEPRHICLLALHQIGDVIMDIPTVMAVRQMFPKAKLTMLAGGGPCDLLQGNPWDVELIPFNANWQKVTRQQSQKSGEAIEDTPEQKFVRLMNELNPDIALVFHSDIHLHRLLHKTNVPVTIGFDVAGGGFHLSHPLRMPGEGHQAERTYQIVQTLGKIYDVTVPSMQEAQLPISSTTQKDWQTKAKELGVTSKNVILHPFGSAQTKNWLPEYWEEVIRWLLDHKHRIAIIGGPQDQLPLSEEIEKKVVSLAGKLSLSESAAALADAELFIGVDSGPGHIAAAVGTPGITIFSGVNIPSRWRPYRQSKWIVLHEPPTDRKTYPYEMRDLPASIKGNPYSEHITPAMVIDAIHKLLS